MDKSKKGTSTSSWDTQAEEDVGTYGFLQFDEEDSAGFLMRPVEIKPALKDDILALNVGMKCLVMVTNKRQVIRKKFDRAEEFKTITLPYKGMVTKVGLYMDLYGYHSIIVISNKAIFYLNHRSDSAIPLEALQGNEITSMAFPSDTQPKNTGLMLVGMNNGSIYTYRLEVDTDEDKIVESEVMSVFQLPDKSPIYGLIYENYHYESKNDGKSGTCTLILATTADKCYQFHGIMPFAELFFKYTQPKEFDKCSKSVPQTSLKESVLKPYYKHSQQEGFELCSFIWKTGAGMCFGKFRGKDKFQDSILVKDFVLESYMKAGAQPDAQIPIPVAVAMNDYHIFLLYQDNLTVVTIITKEIAHSEDFKPLEKMINMSFESSTRSMWLHSIKTLNKLSISPADKDLWKQHLDSGNFMDSLKLCNSTGNKYFPYAASVYADDLFNNKNYIKAAELYNVSNRTFEEVVIKFLSVDANDGLQAYLSKKLFEIEEKSEALVQRVLICSWLIELKLDILNKICSSAGCLITEKNKTTIKNQELVEKYFEYSEDLRNFLIKYEESIDADLIFQLLQIYGKPEDCLWFAEKKRNSEAMVLHYINNMEIDKALEIIGDMPENRKKNELMIKYVSLFIKFKPKVTIECLISSFSSINPEDLIPALMSTDKDSQDFALNFVRQNLEKANSKLVYDLFLFFLAASENKANKEELESFLESQESFHKRNLPVNFDKDFAVSVFKYFGIYSAVVRVYGMLELYEDAVKVALEKGLFQIAKEYASMPKDAGLRKMLWLQVAGAVMGKESPDMQTSFALVQDSKGNLVLNDVIPLVSPKVKLKSFRDDIVSQVQLFDAKINQSRKEIDEYNNFSQEIIEEQKVLENIPILLPPDKGCDRCEKIIVNSGKFFAFPCLHAFHRTCLLDWYDNYRIYMSKAKVEKMETMEAYKKQMRQRLVTRKIPILGGSTKNLIEAIDLALESRKLPENGRTLDEDDCKYLEILEKKFEILLGGECILCGDIAIEKVDVVFDSEEEPQWAI